MYPKPEVNWTNCIEVLISRHSPIHEFAALQFYSDAIDLFAPRKSNMSLVFLDIYIPADILIFLFQHLSHKGRAKYEFGEQVDPA